MRQVGGTHLVIDGYVQDGKVLADPDKLVDLFDKLVDALDMQYLQRPTAIRVDQDKAKLDSDEDEGGWSVICQITTSHIALHGWPLRRAFSLDIFSCKPFSVGKAKDIVFRELDVDVAVPQEIERGGPSLKDRSER